MRRAANVLTLRAAGRAPGLAADPAVASCVGRLRMLTGCATLRWRRGSKTVVQRIARANGFDVVGGVSDAEVELLTPIPPGDRAFVVQTWLVRRPTD